MRGQFFLQCFLIRVQYTSTCQPLSIIHRWYMYFQKRELLMEINQINQINHSGQVSIYTPLSPHTSIQPHLTTKLNLCKFNFWVFFFLRKKYFERITQCLFYHTQNPNNLCTAETHPYVNNAAHILKLDKTKHTLAAAIQQIYCYSGQSFLRGLKCCLVVFYAL